MRASPILATPLEQAITRQIGESGGWLAFDKFMEMALYAPGLGYYANASPKFGVLPAGTNGEGSDFATAPEMTALFGRAFATQIAEALRVTDTNEIWEFGAGTGALALHVLRELNRLQVAWTRYNIVDLSGSLRERQKRVLAEFGEKIVWLDQWPNPMRGVVVGNEVLDAMPVKLLARHGGAWHERGVSMRDQSPMTPLTSPFVWVDRSTDLRTPCEVPGEHNYLTEIHSQAEAFVRSLASHLMHGAAFFVDYGFPDHEYYHAQRHMGTLMCHRAHLADTNPLEEVAKKDITAHVNFTAMALAAQDAGLQVVGYCTQARFLMNCGLLGLLENASFSDKAMAQKLISEHEMGELFKVVGFSKNAGSPNFTSNGMTDWQPIGFTTGDRTHTL